MHVIRWKLGLSNGSDAHGQIQGQNWTTGELLLQSSDVETSILKPPRTPPNGRSVEMCVAMAE